MPARIIKKRFSDEIIDLLMKIKWWDLDVDFLSQKDIVEIFSKPIKLTNLKKLYNKLK